jgi:4-hydroxybenzoate polyprenyltransferase
VTLKEVYFIMALIISLLFISFYFISVNVWSFIIAYIVLNLFYCFGMKNFAIIDVTSISLGFVFRLLAGGQAANVLTTHWIIILIFLLMFSVALAKRRDDLVLSHDSSEIYRQSQAGYTLQFIDIIKTISFSLTLVSYIIYSVSNDVIVRMGSEYVYVTSLPVFLGIMRYIQLTVVYKKSGSPVDLFLKDWFLIITILLWIIIFIFILYV